MRHRSEFSAIYRLLVPPPITVQWRGYTQTLRVRRNPYPPYGLIEILTDSRSCWVDEFKCGLHAEHVLRNGWRVATPSATATLMTRLVRDGFAELVAGPHAPFNNPIMTASQFNLLPYLDARYTYHGPDGEAGKLI